MAIKQKVVQIDTQQATTSVKELKQQLKELRNTLLQTEQGTEEYNNAMRQAADIMHTLKEQTEELNASAMDFGQIVSNSSKAIGGLVGGLQAAKATMNLFGIENEDVMKSLEKMQSLMAITQALPSIDQGVKAFRRLGLVIKTSTASLNGFQKALVATGIGAAVVAVGMLVANWDKLTDAINRSVAAAEKAAQALVDNVKASVDAVKGMIADINKMSDQTVKNLREVAWADLKAATSAEQLGINADDLIAMQNRYTKALKAGNVEIARETKKDLDTILSKHEQTKSAFENFIKVSENLHDREVKASEASAQAAENAAKRRSAANAKAAAEAKKAQDELNKLIKAYQDLQKEISLYGKTNEEKEIIALTDTENEKLALVKQSLSNRIISQEEFEQQALAIHTHYEEQRTEVTKKYAKEREDAEKEEQAKREQAIKETVEKQLTAIEFGYDQQILTISQKELELSEQLASGGITSEQYQEQMKLAQEQELESLIATLEKELEVENLTADQKIAIQQRLVDSKMALNEMQVQNAADSAEREVDKWMVAANGIGNIFSSLGDLMEEGSEEQKAFQIMGATINMLAGITAAISGLFTTKSGPWDIALAAIQATSIAASGAATIAKMSKTKKENAKSSAKASAGAIQAIQAPVQYTQDIQGASIEGAIKDTKVYVTETDISDTQSKVNVAQSEARY